MRQGLTLNGCRCQENIARKKQLRPDCGLGFEVKVLTPSQVVLFRFGLEAADHLLEHRKKELSNPDGTPWQREIGILLPNNQLQHCTLHMQKSVLPLRIVLVTVPRVNPRAHPLQSCLRRAPRHRTQGSNTPRINIIDTLFPNTARESLRILIPPGRDQPCLTECMN